VINCEVQLFCHFFRIIFPILLGGVMKTTAFRLFSLLVAILALTSLALAWTSAVEIRSSMTSNPFFADTLGGKFYIGYSFYEWPDNRSKIGVTQVDTAGNYWSAVIPTAEGASLQALKNINGRLVCLYLSMSDTGYYRHVMVAEINPATGEALSQTDVSGLFTESRGWLEIYGQKPVSDTVYVTWSHSIDSVTVESRYNFLVFRDSSAEVIYPQGRIIPSSCINLWSGTHSVSQAGVWLTQTQSNVVYRVSANDTVVSPVSFTGPFQLFDHLFPLGTDSLVHLHMDYQSMEVKLYHSSLDGQEVGGSSVFEIHPQYWTTEGRDDGYGNILVHHVYAWDSTYQQFGCLAYTIPPDGQCLGFEFVSQRPYYASVSALGEDILALTYSRDGNLWLRRFNRSSLPLGGEEYLGSAVFEFEGAYGLLSYPDGVGGCFVTWTIPTTMSGGHLYVQHVAPSPNSSVDLATAGQPSEFQLGQNYPNPFNPMTVIVFDLLLSGNVRLDIYNCLGRHVATLLNEELTAGRHAIGFDGSALASGMYYYALQSNGFTATRKMVLMK
jgi:hypothetical protein